jgi:hypothetical protein
VKKKDVDMILPTIIALDKTQVERYGRFTISHGLTKHRVHSYHTAMQILGNICHSPAYKKISRMSASKLWTNHMACILVMPH